MFWILLTAFFLIVGVIFTVLYKVAENKMDWSCDGILLGVAIGGWAAFFLIAIITAILLPYEYFTDKRFIETFERQKYYIEEVVPTLPETNNYAITQSRIELNQQLYDLQYRCVHYSFFYFYPNGIMELDPIK